MKYGLTPQKIHVKDSLMQDITITLPIHFTSTFQSWKTSSLLVFQKFRNLTNQYIEGITTPDKHKPTPYTLESYTLQAPLHNKTNSKIHIYQQTKTYMAHITPTHTKTIPIYLEHTYIDPARLVNTN